MLDIKQKIGNRVRELREELALSQEALADKAEVDRTFINHVENGRRNISIQNLEKIILGLEISVKDFFANPEFNGSKARRGK